MRSGPLRVGQDFGPRYHLRKLLGSGGMGVVYLALDRELGIDIALKVLRAPASGSGLKAARQTAELHQRFTRELLLARQVTHKNVIRIYDIGETDGIKFISMPLVKGRDLAAILDGGPLSPSRAILHARQIAAGLSAVHAAGVVHRDLKPANIMIRDDGEAVLMDFGIARAATQVNQQWTAAGGVIGTAAYMAPEQARGEAVDQRADIYAFGLILHEMLCGTKPLMMPDLLARMKAAPAPPSQVNSRVPGALDAIVTRCLQPVPADRYPTINEVARALAALGRQRRSASGRIAWGKWLSRVAAVLVVIGAIALGYSWLRTAGARSAMTAAANGTRAALVRATSRAGVWVRALNPAVLLARDTPAIEADREPDIAAASDTPAEAGAQYQPVSASSPAGATRAVTGLAVLALSEGRVEEAASILEPAIAADLQAHNTVGAATKYLALAEARDGQQRRDAAIAAVHHAVDISHDVDVLLPAGRLLVSLKDEDEARALARELDAQDAPKAKAYARVIDADVALAHGRTGEAIETLRAALRIADLWIVRFVLGGAYLQAGEYGHAFIELQFCDERRDEAMELYDVDAPSQRHLVLLDESLSRAREGMARRDEKPAPSRPARSWSTATAPR